MKYYGISESYFDYLQREWRGEDFNLFCEFAMSEDCDLDKIVEEQDEDSLEIYAQFAHIEVVDLKSFDDSRVKKIKEAIKDYIEEEYSDISESVVMVSAPRIMYHFSTSDYSDIGNTNTIVNKILELVEQFERE